PLARPTYSPRHGVVCAARPPYKITPPLKAGMVVLADRYIYTAFARDVARGVHPDWVRAVYSFAPKPDLTLYFRVPIEVSLDRLLIGRAKLKYHEAGMDLGLSRDPAESFRLFQSRVLEAYDRLVGEVGLRAIQATSDTHTQQLLVRRLVRQVLRDYHGTVADLAAVGAEAG